MTETKTTNEVEVWACATELAARVRAEGRHQLDEIKRMYHEANPGRAGEPWNGLRWCPPTVETAAEAVAFWAEWQGTHFVQPLVEAFGGWRLEDARYFVESDGHDPNGQW